MGPYVVSIINLVGTLRRNFMQFLHHLFLILMLSHCTFIEFNVCTIASNFHVGDLFMKPGCRLIRDL